MGILDDPIQPETGAEKIRSTRRNSSNFGVNTASCYGHVDGDGSHEVDKGVPEKSALIAAVPERKTMREDQRQTCVNGAPQRAYIPKEDAASPTVSTESIFITSAIAASKKRYVWCYDVLSAFVNTDVDENVLMLLRGELAEMLVLIAPQIYRKHITVDKKGTPMLYVQLQKALYGLMQASLLFYRKLRKELEDFGFTVNP